MNIWEILLISYVASVIITLLLGIRLCINDIATGKAQQSDLKGDTLVILLLSLGSPITLPIISIIYMIDIGIMSKTIPKLLAPLIKRIVLGKEYKKAGF